MQDWTAGYVADIGYTYGYYTELNPLRIRLALLNAGVAAPAIGTACELGFGQGVSINVHAAASTADWYGTDFNPSQAAFSQELAAQGGTGARTYDESFAEFANRQDLPDFDYIGLHGIWSWVSDENRAIITDFIRRKLKVGGVVYVSYNTLPGWSGFAPIRHLLTEHAKAMGSDGDGIVSKINGAIGFAEKMLASNPAFLRQNPQIKTRFDKMKEHSRHYLAHEYFNKDWEPMFFSQMNEWMNQAKMTFCCSAFYLDHVKSLNFTAENQEFMKTISDKMMQETVRDFMVNQQFRRDYWVKGPRQLSVLDKEEQLGKERVVLVANPADISMKVNGALGEATISEEVCRPIIEVLADGKIHTVKEVVLAVRDKGINNTRVHEFLLILIGAGHVAAVQEDRIIEQAKRKTTKLNAVLMQHACGSSDIAYLASPVTGGAISVGRFQQLFLLARTQGKKTPEEWAAFAWQVFSAQSQKLIKEGKTIESAEDNLAELLSIARTFEEKTLPIAKRLGLG